MQYSSSPFVWLMGGLVFGIAPSSLTGAPPESTAPDGYNLVWSDEFDADALNTDAWLYRTTRRGKTSICLPENVSLEDGKLRIACRKENHDGIPMTCGGIITRKQYRYGYYEVSTRMHGGRGWHEAFWTTWRSDLGGGEGEWKTKPRIEIDGFEHFAEYDVHKFCFGIIEWYPVHGGLSRTIHTSKNDLSKTFNVFGFEFTPEFMNFYFNGELLETVDVRDVAHNPFHLWLSTIGTKFVDEAEDGYCDFEYLRCYETDFNSPVFRKRRDKFVTQLDKERAVAPPSSGDDLWIEAEDFANLAAWSAKRDRLARIVEGQQDRKKDAPESETTATTTIAVPKAGKYRLWVRARDYAKQQPGKRFFSVAVDGKRSDQPFGTHHQEGLAWQDGGVFELESGEVKLELIDSSRYFARCDKLLLTTDLDYRPSGWGRPSNVKHRGK